MQQPLITLLKKDGFVWTDQATHVFQARKRAMTTTPVLDLSGFSNTFVLEYDAFGVGNRAVLMQKGRPIAFISKVLSNKALAFSTYEKKMMAIIYAITKWRPYLLRWRF